ncbi:MAG: AAA family ATPase [Bacillota bacterium]
MKTYIKRLCLRNFQSHRETDLEFTPGLNIIVGPSDQGKSAIIRALRWLIFNEPRGTGFIRVGETRCQVRVEMSNGVAVERIRDESSRINRYILEIPGEEAMVFERFNKDVPLEVRKALGIQKLVIDRDRALEINLASQLEAPFLLEESGTTRSKILGRMANLHIIDAAQRDTLRDTNQALQEISRLEGDIESLEIQLQDYADLEEEETRLQAIEQLLQRLTELDQKVTQMEEAGNHLEQNRRQMTEIRAVLGQLDQIDEAYEIQTAIGRLSRELQEIRGLQEQRNQTLEELKACYQIIDSTQGLEQTEEWLETIKSLRQEGFELQVTRKELAGLEKERRQKSEEMSYYEAIIESLKGIDRAEQEIQVITALVTQLDSYSGLLSSWQEVEQGIKAAGKELQDIDARVQSLADEYGELLQSVGRCPTCFAEINQDTIARIRREIL